MNFKEVWKCSLKTRVTLGILVIFMITIWSLALFASLTLRRDMQRLLGGAQFSTVTLLAAQIDDEITTRLKALELLAARVRPEQMASPVALQDMLESRPVFQGMFSGGAFITGTDGIALASYPATRPRAGLNFEDRDYFRTAALRGLSNVGSPVIGKASGKPVLVLSTPIRDDHSKVIGVLAGVVDLGLPTFLDQISKQPFGDKGTYFIVSRHYRQIVTSSDKSRVLEVLPQPGVNPELDKFVDGHEGTQVFVNPLGVEVLAAVKSIPSADWYAAVALPTAEVFAPVHNTRDTIAGAAVIVTLLASGLIWLILKRELMPLQTTAGTLAAVSDLNQISEQLPVGRQDEIGQVITGFNRLIQKLIAHRTRLVESEERYRIAFRTSPDALALSRMADGVFLDVNDGYTGLIEWSREDMIGRAAPALEIWTHLDDRRKFVQLLDQFGHCKIETELKARSGARIPVQITASKVMIGEEACVLSVIHDLSAERAAQNQIRQLEYSDSLTGLPNRRRFLEQLGQGVAAALRYQRLGALIYVDLDNFKSLNDTFCHDEGDALLKTVASRIKSCVHSEDTVARIGGDEFVVLLEDLDSVPGTAASQAETIAQAIHAALLPPCSLPQAEHRMGCSIGITLFGQHNEAPAEPLKRAELAMYQAKAAGRNMTFFFEPQMQAMAIARASLESSLHSAIENNQFQLFYQVQVGDDGEACGAEALVRWHDPKRGMVSPGEFIPLAESTGLIIPLGQWVIETACQQLAKWSGQPELERLTIAVNVSSRQFGQGDFIDQLLAALQRSGANPNRLKLELTESTLVTDFDAVVMKMNALKSKGVAFSLDDFGTGFSSLSYLKRLPLDQLKIDQSFVRDVLVDSNDLAIAKMVVALSNSLGLEVIAEGVETKAQRDVLAAMGCRTYQGYLFGRPMQIEDFERNVKQMCRLEHADSMSS